MPEVINNIQAYSLMEVANNIGDSLRERYKFSFWVKAEMNKLNYYKHSGHCYPELVHKEGGKVLALMKGVLWQDDFQRINRQFLQVLKEPLKDGIKILFLASVTFDPAHGLSLRISQIDAGYTLGDLEQEKAETIQRLQQDGIYDQNKRLKLALVPKRLAIISVETSKGYADFVQILDNNKFGYCFEHTLYPSLLQGERAISSMVSQLREIAKVQGQFDAVCIIRGGGGDVGLSCYNHYDLCRAIALFPLPILTGIGHATNTTVSEMVSYANRITPTNIAEFLIQCYHNVAGPLHQAGLRLDVLAKRMVQHAKTQLQQSSYILQSKGEALLRKNEYSLKSMDVLLGQHARSLLKDQRNFLLQMKEILPLSAARVAEQRNLQLQNILQIIKILDPKTTLERGYSITYHNGRIVSNLGEIKIGDAINTVFSNGQIQSVIEDINDEK